jgi:short/branched chain acyl-CoA dehydrogenase
MLSSLLVRRRSLVQLQRRAMSSTTGAAQHLASLHTLSDEETALRDLVRKFATEQVKPRVAEMDRTMSMDRSIIDGMFANGLMAIELETEHGGSGASFMSAVLAIEELARVDASVSVCCDVQNTLVVTGLRQWASDAQKREWLPRLARDTVGSFCLSEAGAGTDAFALATTAKDAGDHWVINGSKMWITNAHEAGLFVVFANTDHSKGYKGISAFLVPRATPGVEVGKKEDKLGIRASSTCPIHFTDVKIPKSSLLGKHGLGYKYAIEILNEGRIGIGAQMLGVASGVFDLTVPYLLERKQFGQPIFDFQAMQHQVAEIALEIEAARLLVYNAARMRSDGLPFVHSAAMAKLAASRIAEKAASQCINWCGGVGMTRGFQVEKYFRDCKIGQIYEGTSNIQLSTIAKHIKKQFE